jgi:hypothetical protein
VTFKSSHEAELQLIKFNEELKESIRNRGILESAMNEIKRRELDIRLEKNRLDEGIRQARENGSRLRIEIDITEKVFWQMKRDGL